MDMLDIDEARKRIEELEKEVERLKQEVEKAQEWRMEAYTDYLREKAKVQDCMKTLVHFIKEHYHE